MRASIFCTATLGLFAMVRIAVAIDPPTIEASVSGLDKEARAKLGVGVGDLSVLLVDARPNQYIPTESADKSGLSAAAARLEAKGYITIQRTAGGQGGYITLVPTALGQRVLDSTREESLAKPVMKKP